MRWDIPVKLQGQFTDNTREAVVVLEAARILYRCTFDQVRSKFPEIPLKEEPFVREQHATAGDLRLGERMAEIMRDDFRAEQKVLLAKAKGKAETAKEAKI